MSRSSLARFGLFLLALTLLAPTTRADDGAALQVTADICRLVAETSLIVADHEPDRHAAKAKDVLDRLATSVPALIATTHATDAVKADEMRADWDDLASAYDGEPFGVNFRVTSTDTNATAHYSSGYAGLLAALAADADAQAAQSPETRAPLLVWRALTGYLQFTTGIVGGTSSSANSEEADFTKQVQAFDEELAALQKKHAGSAKATALLTRVQHKWQFIRPAFLNTSGKAMPFVVYKHSLDIIDALDALAALKE